MNEIKFSEAIQRAQKIRELYHELELTHHGSKWSVEEDALAFLTDAGLVGRLIMAQQGRWPKGNNAVPELAHKLGECIWWLMVIGGRMDIDVDAALDAFLTKTETMLKQ